MKTQGLTGLQVAFHDHLLNRSSTIWQEVVDGGHITIDHRLNIYHNAYRVRLLENLQDAYEKTWAYLGDDSFQTTASAYIEENPPTHRNLRWHGASFPAWLASQFPNDGDIAELAYLDWMLRQAFDCPDATPIQAEELSGLMPAMWETVGFQLTPSLRLSPLRYNSVSIWHALDQEQVPPTAELLPETSCLLIWRKGWQPHFRTIREVEAAALKQLQQGTSFAAVCATLINQFSEVEAATVAAESLRNWLTDELIVGLHGVPVL